MRKWVLLVVVVVVAVGVVGGGFMTVRQGRQMKADWSEYAGTYVADSGNGLAHRGDALTLRPDGTWILVRKGRTLDEGGEPGGALPTIDALKDLNWLGPSATADCLDDAEPRCSRRCSTASQRGLWSTSPRTTRRRPTRATTTRAATTTACVPRAG